MVRRHRKEGSVLPACLGSHVLMRVVTHTTRCTWASADSLLFLTGPALRLTEPLETG